MEMEDKDKKICCFCKNTQSESGWYWCTINNEFKNAVETCSKFVSLFTKKDKE